MIDLNDVTFEQQADGTFIQVDDPPKRADMVAVVRCRDCKRFAVDQSDHDYRSGWWCHRWNTDMVKPDGFCAWGERRDA